MQLNEYQRLAERTANRGPEDTTEKRLLNFTLGITGEAGEFANLVKKIQYHGHNHDRDKLQEELGDILWYVATLATTIGCSLGDVAKYNITKLRCRYPEGFSEERSRSREV